MAKLRVQRISYGDAYPWIKRKHYAKRVPSMSYIFGLFEDHILIGVVSFGKPPSPDVCNCICGIDFRNNVLELNRLVLDGGKNHASFLISNAMKELPKETIVISYADTGMSHIGYIYQASNFIYTGMSKEKMDRYDPNNPSKHSRSCSGENFPKKLRTAKHRYIYFVGSSGWKKRMIRDHLKLPILEYPKGELGSYDASFSPNVQMVMF